MKKSILVCGAGTMGAGIAQLAAQHGFNVTLYDVAEAAVRQANEQIEQRLSSLVEKQKITAAAHGCISKLLTYTTSISACTADIIIEAIAEKPEAKTALFNQLAELNGPHSLYATNTSSLSVTEIARRHSYPEKLAGFHFFNPATIMKLVEVVQTEFSTEETIQSLIGLATDLGKTPVVCKDSPGFIVNRVARPYYIEALRLAEEGVPIELIDRLLESAGFKMGPFKLMDLIGNDVNLAVSKSVYEQLDKPLRLRPSALQENLVMQGKLGRKTGAGFYIYSS